ncbi:HET domain containing protein, partial [Hyaloscypha variabilis]
MRLLNTRTIQLHEFFDDHIPLYVILSHRWEGSEVTFQDLNGGRTNKKGYEKILGCCAQAREHGYEFAWIDSCCIDKSSSAELSEAINSMFRWYQNAEMCYAYLSDVFRIDSRDDSRDLAEVSASMWFTRGWTLQELLAPEIVIFYNHDWVELGTKASMAALISSITNIEPDFLTGARGMQRACVAQKMSWASRRKTTRLEDTAYSLMGLFDVNMPLLYGEGKKAFYRLQLEIIKSSADESIFAWGRANAEMVLRGLYGILADGPEAFQGSEDVVWEYSLRPPYTMTNKGLQIEANLIQIPGLALGWSLSLHCHRREEEHKNLAIRLMQMDGELWSRSSDLIMSLEYPPQKDANGKRIWGRQIIIEASKEVSRIDTPGAPEDRFEIDVRALLGHGYIVSTLPGDPALRAWPGSPGWEGVLSDRLLENQSRWLKDSLCLQCENGQDDFRLTISRHPKQLDGKGGFSIEFWCNKTNRLFEDRVIPSSRKVVTISKKRKLESGKSIDVLEVLI